MPGKWGLAAFAFAVTACGGERLTGIAAEDATRRYQTSAALKTADPLFFVDGKEMTGDLVRALSPESIESIEIVKGPAAIRAYGDRAANGAIVIQTKSPVVLSEHNGSWCRRPRWGSGWATAAQLDVMRAPAVRDIFRQPRRLCDQH